MTVLTTQKEQLQLVAVPRCIHHPTLCHCRPTRLRCAGDCLPDCQEGAAAAPACIHSFPPSAPCPAHPQEIASLTVKKEQLQRRADATERRREALLAQVASLKQVGSWVYGSSAARWVGRVALLAQAASSLKQVSGFMVGGRQ